MFGFTLGCLRFCVLDVEAAATRSPIEPSGCRWDIFNLRPAETCWLDVIKETFIKRRHVSHRVLSHAFSSLSAHQDSFREIPPVWASRVSTSPLRNLSLAGCYLSLALNLKNRDNSECLCDPQRIFSYEFRFCILNDFQVFKLKLLQVPHVNVDYSRRGSRAASQLRAGLITFAHFFFLVRWFVSQKKGERDLLSWLIQILWPAQVRRTHSRRGRTVTTSCKQMHNDESRWSACGSR